MRDGLDLHTVSYWRAAHTALTAPTMGERAEALNHLVALAHLSPYWGVKRAARRWMETYIGGGYSVLPLAPAMEG